MKHLKRKTSRINQAIIPWVQTSFKRTYRDAPASSIPNTALADSVNFLPFDARAVGRHGCRAVADASVVLPTIAGLENYEATKSGTTITKTVGISFTADFVNHYFVWPSGQTADLIVAFISATQVTVDNSLAKTAATAGSPGKIRGRINDKFFSKKDKVTFIHMGTSVYYSNNTLATYVLVNNISGDPLPNTKSTFNEYRGKIYLSTDSGHYVIDSITGTGSDYYLVKVNSGTVSTVMSSDTPTSKHALCRRYLYSYTRMTGSYFNDRTSSANAILKESAVNKVNDTTNIDYATKCFNSIIQTVPDDDANLIPYNDGGLFTVIEGDLLSATALAELLPFTNGKFIGRFQVGSGLVDREIAVNFSEIKSWEDIALILQASIRSSYPDAKGEPEVKVYKVNDVGDYRFEINGGSFNGSHCSRFTYRAKGSVTATGGLIDTTLNQFITRKVKVGDVVTNLVTGDTTTVTFVSSASVCDTATSIFTAPGQGYTVEPANDVSELLGLREDDTFLPTIKSSLARHSVIAEHVLATNERQWTHVSYYGTPNLKTQPESSNVYAWLFDIPLVKAMRGSLAANGIVTLTAGTITLQDVGRTVTFFGGTQYAVGEYISPTSFVVARGVYAGINSSVVVNKLFRSTGDVFNPSMVGNTVLNTVTGATTTVLAYVSSTELTLSAHIFTSLYHRYEIYAPETPIVAQVMGMNSQNPFEASQVGNAVTITLGTVNMAVGDAMFWSDGGISHITAKNSPTSYVVADSKTRTTLAAVEFLNTNQEEVVGTTDGAGAGGITDSADPFFVRYGAKAGMNIINSTNSGNTNITEVNPNGVKMLLKDLIFESPPENYLLFIQDSFNDTITDDVLINRVSDWPVRTRFYDPLPDTRLAAIHTGFWYVAALSSAEVQYSQMSQLLEYFGGHYYAPYQNVPVKDAIKSLREFPEQTIVYCSRSTYRINTNVTNIVTIPEIGESVALISGISLVDGDLGIADEGSIQDVEQGQQLLITSEPGVRIFNGVEFGENLAVDGEGRPMFLKDLEALHKAYASAYDPVMGYLFWGVPSGTFAAGISADNILTTKCFRVGIMQEQARGWGEITGAAWPFLRPNVGMLKMIDSLDAELLVLFDESDGKSYTLDKKVFTDKAVKAGTGGTEIATRVRFKEHVGSRESYRIKHLISHFYVRPQFETNQNTSGHSGTGMRNAQVFTIKAFEDGKLVAQATIANILSDGLHRGELAFDNKIVGNRIQLEFSTAASEYQLIQHDTDYIEKDSRALPQLREMPWTIYQRQLQDVLFWVARNEFDNTINRATNNRPDAITGQLYDFTGPCNSLNGGIYFLADSSIDYKDEITLDVDFSISFWVYNAVDNVEVPLINVGSGATGLEVRIKNIPAGGSVIYLDVGTESYVFNTTVQFGNFGPAEGYNYVRISRRFNTYYFQVNKEIEGTPFGIATDIASGPVTLSGRSGMALADVRMYRGDTYQALSDYYYDDVLDRSVMHLSIGGGKVLPFAIEAPEPS